MDRCGFASTVRTEKAENLASFNGKRKVVECHLRAEMFCCALKFERGSHSGIVSRGLDTANSVSVISLIFHPGLIRNPIDFPGLATIVRVGLFKMSRIRRDL